MNISVIITTYRRKAMLVELLEALSPQLEAERVEVIVIDNCPDGSARTTVETSCVPAIRYVHEPRSGVVNARNRGVAEARGTYLIFLDDDEVPSAGWLTAWLSQADGITDMAFGRIVPRLLGMCPPELLAQTIRAYSREMSGPTGTDISTKSAYVGTGNAMFHKGRCFTTSSPFDLRFNERGGEDVWLINSLKQQGRRLKWNREALVEELVPGSRMTVQFAKARKFNQGQMRCIMMCGEGGVVGTIRVGIWMAAGAIQFAGFGIAACVLARFDRVRATDFICRSQGGAGKLMWWHTPDVQDYGENQHV